jgi:phospholipid/cholesterol/gamma-HCH transport system substrate-binding protein
MQYSSEIKVGIAIVIAVAVFFAGLRFFQDLPIFRDSYTMQAQFEDAGGIVSGNPVRMKGVSIGTVQSVVLDQETQLVEVRFRVNEGVQIPEGSYAEVTGFSALSGVRLSIVPGPSSNPALPPNATLSEPPKGDILERLSDQAPVLATKADSVLTNTNTVVRALGEQVDNPQSDLRQLLSTLTQTARNLQTMTEGEDAALRATVRNLEAISADLERFTGTDTDTLEANNMGKTMARLNRSITRLDTTLARLESTTANLSEVSRKMNEGEGTIGRLVNDDGLYMKLDSAATEANGLLRDLRDDPSRYLKDMTLVKVF